MSASPTASTTTPLLDAAKFRDPRRTATGEERAQVELETLETLWFNTGTLCNIECRRCYIESGPTNDRLVYIGADEVERYLDEIAELGLTTRTIGFTGGEPFMNPEFLVMVEECLNRGFRVLVLTNAMRPLMLPATRARLLRLHERFGQRLHLRVSLDHYTRALHEVERGPRSWDSTLRGLGWLVTHGFHLSVAGRTCWNEEEAAARLGYARLFAELGLACDAGDPAQLVLFPEMDPTRDVPEITSDCWGALGVEPSSLMCATSRMVVKRRAASSTTVVSCTLLPYDARFELGSTLREACGPMPLNHPHCARFCVLGGGSCSAG